MAEYISRAALMGELTSSDMQQKIKAMSGAEAYNEFLTLLNAEKKADVVPVAMLEKWLWEIALNNYNNYLSDACEDIIRRLPGLRVFVAEIGGVEMAEYIDRAELLEQLKDMHDFIMQDPGVPKLTKWREAVIYENTIRIIKAIPKADVAEVRHG